MMLGTVVRDGRAQCALISGVHQNGGEMMLIVPIKQVVDYRLTVQVDEQGQLPLSQLKQSINPLRQE